MPKIEVETKFQREEECYFLLWGAICKGEIKQVNIYFPNREFAHDLEEQEGMVDITPIGEDVDPNKPIIEYYIKVNHPLLNRQPLQLQRFTEGRVYRNPKALIAAIQSRFNKTYETSI